MALEVRRPLDARHNEIDDLAAVDRRHDGAKRTVGDDLAAAGDERAARAGFLARWCL